MKEITKIMGILAGNDEANQKKILLECATRIGSNEWKEAIKDLWERMEKLEKKKQKPTD